jgi:uncharacterized protein (UPF0371 family)
MSFIYASRVLHELKGEFEAAVVLTAKDLQDRKAILDVASDTEALVDVFRQLQRCVDGDISREDFLISYNIYRSRRGQLVFND